MITEARMADSDKGNGIAVITGNGTYYYEEDVKYGGMC